MPDLTPEQITAATNAFKEIQATHPQAGTALAIIASLFAGLGVINSGLTWISNIRTKKNTEANDSTAKMLAIHKTDMIGLKEEATNTIKSSIKEFQTSLTSEVDKIKIAVVKVNNATDQRLGMIPKIEAAIEKHNVEIDVLNKNMTTLISGLERRKKP